MAKAPERNEWTELLKQSTKSATKRQSQLQNCSLFVLGTKGCGKSALLSHFADRVIAPSSDELVVEYSYITVKNKFDADAKDDSIARMNIWQIDDISHVPLIQNLLSIHGLIHSSFVIAIDFSDPASAEAQLKFWLDVIATSINAAPAVVSSSNSSAASPLSSVNKNSDLTELRMKLSRYIQFFVDPSQQADSTVALSAQEMENAEVDQTLPATNLGVPIIVVGCKADLLSQSLAKLSRADDRFNILLRKLRLICFEYGAALFVTSAKGAKGVNIDLLQDYIFHRTIDDFELKVTAKPELKSFEEVDVRIPTGYDKKSLIEESSLFSAEVTGDDSSLNLSLDANLSELFPEVKQDAEASRIDKLVEAFNNESYVDRLHQKIRDGPSASSSRALPASPNRTAPTAAAVASPAADSSSQGPPSSPTNITAAKPGPTRSKEEVRQFFASLRQSKAATGAVP